MPTPEMIHVIEIVGEGKTDRGRGSDQPELPTHGIVPVLVHRLCNRPHSMLVRTRPLTFLQGKGLWQKVRFAKRQAFYNRSAGMVFVVDTEGKHPGQQNELSKGRDFELTEYPTAIGVAHPCIEAWLLSDADAIARVVGCTGQVAIPERPESLPAPCRDRDQNPKAILGRCGGQNHPLPAARTTRIAQEIADLDTIRSRCPIGFAPFADEVVANIRPIFERRDESPAES